MAGRRKRVFKPHLWLIRAIGFIVPRRFRPDWKREWEAELRHREEVLERWDRLDSRARLNLLRRSLGAFRDAMWFQPKRLEEDMFQDLRYGMRMLSRGPVFTAVAIISLALGIGANTAIFSLIDTVLLKKLPVKNPDELALLRWESGREAPFESLDGSMGKRGDKTNSTSFSYLMFEMTRDHNDVFTDVFAFAEVDRLNVSVDGRAEVTGAQTVSGGYYSTLGISAVEGRTITADDDRADVSEPVVVISYAYWQRRFGGDPQAVGKTIYLNGSQFTIVGVAPQGFSGTLQAGEITVPMAMQSRVRPGGSVMNDPSYWGVQIIGRLKPGVTYGQAQAGLDVIFQQSVAESLKRVEGKKDPARLDVTSGSRGLNDAREELSELLFILMVVVGLVLAIACMNIANLLLARAATRSKEIAVRLSLGASRLRLIRQLLTESVLLAVAGGAVGLLFAYGIKDLLLSLLSNSPSRLNFDIALDARVLGFTAAISILTGILFGLAPALRATRLELAAALKDNARSASRVKSRLGKALLVAQVAMSLLLLVGAGLFVRTLRNLGEVELGFNAENLLLFKVDPSLNGYKDVSLAGFYEQAAERIEAIPGVRSVSMSRHPFVSGSARISNLSVPGLALPPGKNAIVYIQNVRPNFLRTMEIPLLSGRDLSVQDDGSTKVAVINERFAREYFPGENPIGRVFKVGRPGKGDDMLIVGMAGDVKYASVRRETPPTIYVPYAQEISNMNQMSFEVRTEGDPARLVPAISQAVQSVDANVPLYEVKTQSEQVDQSLARERMFAKLSTFFGLLALMLACIGLYGVMSYGVARRTHEIGIRMALGAHPGSVLWLVMKETLLLVIIGIVIGLPAALAATQLISSMLFGLTPTDPLTVCIATVFMMGVAAFAGYLPARRASHVDPMIALRYE